MTMHSYTLATLRESARALLNAAKDSFYASATLNSYINESVRDIAIRTGCYRDTKAVFTSAGVRTVAFTGHRCLFVEHNGNALLKTTPLQHTHAKLSGEVIPQYWFEYGAPSQSVSYIGIDPLPTAAFLLKLYVSASPPDMVNDDDVSDLPYPFCTLVPFRAASLALREDRKNEAANLLLQYYNNDLTFLAASILPNIPDGDANLRVE